jgi:hypothetical protein
MEEKEKIKTFVIKIISNEIANEEASYELAEDFLMKKLYEENIPMEQVISNQHGHNEFFSEAGQILASISVLAGTIKTYLEIKKLIKENKTHKTEKTISQWKTDLINNGLPIEKAEKLSKKYESDLKLLLQ